MRLLAGRFLASCVNGTIALVIAIAVTTFLIPGYEEAQQLVGLLVVSFIVRTILRTAVPDRLSPGLALVRLHFVTEQGEPAPLIRRLVWNLLAGLIWFTIVIPPFFTPIVLIAVLAASLLRSGQARSWQDRAAGVTIIEESDRVVLSV